MKKMGGVTSLVILGLLLSSLVVTGASSSDVLSCTTDVVAAASGPVCGRFHPTPSGKQAKGFLGIPFAESTAGKRRWQPPVVKPQWKKTVGAVTFGSMCPQSLPANANAAPAATNKRQAHNQKTGTAVQAPTRLIPESEDCLNLNVWAPADAVPDANLPVMVFIYGGSFVSGDSADPLYDGAYLAANKNVIVVSFNYRVGVFGFLATDELDGNYGFLDQQLALSWVQNNIAAFGGAPDKVTIFGESAGAMSVGLHLFSAPASAPLFRAGIMESNFLALPYKRLREQINVGNIFSQGMNCQDMTCLKRKSIHDLLHAQAAFTPLMSTVFSGAQFYLPFAPSIDGDLLTRQPIDGWADGVVKKPVLLGTNKNEAVLFVQGRDIFPPEYSAWAASLFGTAFERVINRYPANTKGGNSALWARVQTDNFLICSTRHLAATLKSPVYAYLFNHQPSFEVWGGGACREDDNVCHGDELPFVFHSADKIGGGLSADEEGLSSAVMDYWTNFATHLDPNGTSTATNGPLWPSFNERSKEYLALNTPTISVANDPYRETCAFWDTVGYELTAPWAN